MNSQFVTWLVGHGDRLSTAQRRARRIAFLAKNMDISEPGMEQIYQYIERRQMNGVKHKTLRVEMNDLRKWFQYQGKEVTLPRFKREPSPDPFVPSPAQVFKVRTYCLSKPNRQTWLRNLAIIDILSTTGIRIGELARINLEDFKGDTMFIRSEKGEKNRYLPLVPDVAEEIKEYIAKYRMETDHTNLPIGRRALFTTERGRMPYDYLRTMIKKTGIRAGMPELHAHSFRHYYAVNLIRMGLGIRQVQILLGHASISSTQIYTQLSDREVGESALPYIQKLFREKRDLNLNDRIHVGADTDLVGSLGFEPRSTGLFRFIVPVTHHKSGDP